jgi:hypothetical protein
MGQPLGDAQHEIVREEALGEVEAAAPGVVERGLHDFDVALSQIGLAHRSLLS